MIDERTEQLINRRLDDLLDSAESLELDKRLIRSPEARLAMEDYARNDAAAADALRSWLRPAAHPHQLAREIAAHQHWTSRVGVAVRAVAAALLLITMAGVPTYWTTGARPSQPGNHTLAPAVASLAPSSPLADPLVEGPREETHDLQRNIVGVWDEETQSYYILELDEHARKVLPYAMNF